jgi:hypothetical protein
MPVAALAGATLLLGACAASPTQPQAAPSAPPASASRSAANVAPALATFAAFDLSPEIEALTERVIPSFQDERAAADLRTALAALVERAAAADRGGTTKALAGAHAALRDGAAGASDLDAIRQTLDAIERAVFPTPDHTRAP